MAPTTEAALGYRPGRLEDAALILELQRLAYASEAALYDDPDIPSLRQTLPELEAELRQKTFLTAWVGTALVGSVRASLQDGTCRIERLIVHPAHQGRGLGSGLLERIERQLPAQAYALFTGHKSERNLRLYERLGYVRGAEETISPTLRFIHLEKRRPA